MRFVEIILGLNWRAGDQLSWLSFIQDHGLPYPKIMRQSMSNFVLFKKPDCEQLRLTPLRSGFTQLFQILDLENKQ